MAQYGRSYYGASYYGASGVFTGQFQSDQTALLAPVDDLVFDIIAKFNRKLYQLPASIPPSGMARSDDTTDQYLEYWRSVYRIDGVWTGNETTDTNAIATALFAGSDMKVYFGSPASPAVANILIRRYELGEPVETMGPFTVDTALESEFSMETMPFGEYEVDISIDASSAADSSLILSGIEINTNDISLELRTENSSIWSKWARIPLTHEELEPGIFNLYSGPITEVIDEDATINVAGSTGYEFRLFMATSEDENSPEVTRLDIRTSNIHTRAEVGIWKMAIDMGYGASIGVDDVLSVEYDADIPEGTSLSIQTRSTDHTDIEDPLVPESDISWSDWSVPYSKATYRMIIDTKTNPSLRSAVIYTPVITPENLKRWTRFIPKMYINYHDPLNVDMENQVINNHSSIKIEVLDGNLDIIKTPDQWGATNESRYIFTKPLEEASLFYQSDGQFIPIGQIAKRNIYLVKTNELGQEIPLVEGSLENNGDYTFIENDTLVSLNEPIGENEKVALMEIVPFENISKPIRLRIFLYRDLPYSTPAIENIDMFAASEYTEIKTFDDTGLVAYASAVFGDNTGEDYLYLDGKTRSIEASVSNLGFTLPGVEGPDGISPLDYAEYRIEGAPNNVTILWDDVDDPSTILTSDRLVAKVKTDGTLIKKHVQYGSGITISIDGEDFPDSQNTTAIFSPPLDPAKEYAYHLKNGYTDTGTTNSNVELRWKTENDLQEGNRRNISYIQSEEVYSSIKSAISGNIIDWKSDEIMLEGYVNLGSPSTPIPYLETISSRLPEIPPDAIITNESPYVVEIVPNTVKSEGEIKDESRISLRIDDSYRKYVEVTEEKVLIIRGPAETNQDFLPKANTISVYGIYRSMADYAPSFWEGAHFTITDGKIIDWSIMMNDPNYSGPTPPVEGEELYITYTYEKLSEMKVIGECSYNRNDYSSVNIYRSKNAISFDGICSYGTDYVSDQIDLESIFAIPDDVDKRTLKPKVVITDNPYVKWYEKDNRIVVTLGDINPKENWHPTIKEGFYYLGKDSYYLFSSPGIIALDESMAPRATNVSYADFNDGLAVAIQDGTVNMIGNPEFLQAETSSTIFKDGFER